MPQLLTGSMNFLAGLLLLGIIFGLATSPLFGQQERDIHLNESIDPMVGKHEDLQKALRHTSESNKAARTEYAKMIIDKFGGRYEIGNDEENRGELLSVRLDFSNAFDVESAKSDSIKSITSEHLLLLIRDAHKLKVLELRNARVSDESLKNLVNLKELFWLDLEDNPLKDAGLKHLAGLTNLKLLNLGHTDIDGTGLRNLFQLRKLESICLHGTRVTSSSLENLARFTMLTHIDLRATKIDDACGPNLARLKRLENVDISSNTISASIFCELTGLRKIKSLSVENTQIAGFEKDYMAFENEHPQCDVRATFITTSSYVYRVAQYRAIESIKNLGGSILFSSKKDCIAKNPHAIESIVLANTDCSDRDLILVSLLTGTKRLSLSQTKISNGGAIHLAKMSKLSYLDLSETSICDSGINHLAINLPELRVLNLANSGVQTSFYSRLGRKIKLEGETEYRARQNAIHTLSDLGCRVEFSRPKKKLVFADASDPEKTLLNDVPQEITVDFARAKNIRECINQLKYIYRLKSISFGGTNFNDSDTELLAEQLNPERNGGKRLPFLRTINLLFTKVSDRSAEKLDNSLPGVTISHRFVFRKLKSGSKMPDSDNDARHRNVNSGFRFSKLRDRIPRQKF